MARKAAQAMVELWNPPLSPRPLPNHISDIRDASSPQQALRLYKRTMRSKSARRHWQYPMHTHAAVFILKSVSRLSDSIVSRSLHAHLFKTCIWMDRFVSAALLHCYVASSLNLGDAFRLYDEMPSKNIVSLNTLLKGFCYGSLAEKGRTLSDVTPENEATEPSAMIPSYINSKKSVGLKIFRELMKDEDRMPDQVTFVTVLSGLTAMGSMRVMLGKAIHGYCVRNGLELTKSLSTALINLYTKNGCLSSAFNIFKTIPVKDVVPWSAMICGLAMHGYGQEAISSFMEMKNAGIVPNEITFTGVLNACCHSGLVDEGMEVFHSMTVEHGLQPNIRHYGCMVEMLGKAGRLEEAYDVISGMSVEPNLVIFTSFLASCKRHKNFDVASRVLEQVLEMPIPDGDGGLYPLVADIYAMDGQWDKVEGVWKLMEGVNALKSLGLSAI